MRLPSLPTLAPATARDRVKPEDLNVATALLGLPLARPSRRLMAMALDLAVIGALSAVANLWLLAALALPLLEHARGQRLGRSNARRSAAWVLALLLAVVGVHEIASPHAPGSATSWALDDDDDADDKEAGADTRAATAAEPGADTAGRKGKHKGTVVATDTAALQAVLAAMAASSPGWAASGASAVAASVALAEAKANEAQAARAARAAAASAAAVGASAASGALASPGSAAKPERTLRQWLAHWRDEIAHGYGWSIVYFTLLPGWWRGQTLGKRVFGLRVVELTGKPMTPMRNLKRYGGYAAGMATGGLGLAQLLWDSNRQAIQDKTAHTVVVNVRAERAESAEQAPA